MQLLRVMRGVQRLLGPGNPTRFHVDALGRDVEVGRYETKGPNAVKGEMRQGLTVPDRVSRCLVRLPS